VSQTQALAKRWLSPGTTRWVFALALILLAWGLRVVALETVPPGWRDDELINIHALSGELFEGRFPLYFTGASGHEPLYHYLHAGVNAVLGYNVVSGHLLSAILGTLSVALTFVLVHRLFGFPAAALASLALATSFWSLMYSRIALRHVSLLPFALTAFYLLWTPLTSRAAPSTLSRTALSDPGTLSWALPLGGVLGLSLYTYPVSRLLPFMLIVFALYLGLLRRDLFRRAWAGYALALLLTVALALPLLLSISGGSSEAAAEGIGADARLVELARPIRALRQGDPGPLLETTWTTLNMFHATGDPEALYNLPDRPVFNIVGGLLFWTGVLLCLIRWRRPRYFFLILWLGVGLLPTVLSVPPASLSHSILVQPLTYLLPALALTEGYRAVQRRLAPGLDVSYSTAMLVALVCVFLVPVTYRDLRDYFWRWPRYDFVRFLYRADYRDAAVYLDDNLEIQDWAVGSLLMGPWDRLALDVDVQRDDAAVRLFDPQRALVFASGASPASALLTSYPPPAAPIARLLQEDSAGQLVHSGASFSHYLLKPETHLDQDVPLARFDNGLELIAADWDEWGSTETPGNEAVLLTVWRVAETLDLPQIPVVANPPPPGVYSGPRLAAFTHLLAPDGAFLVGDDGLWVDPLTLRPGDQFVQLHRFAVPVDAPDGPYAVELGLYDPKTGQRWSVLDAAGEPIADRVFIMGDQGDSPIP
jgi:4-amino-4-deoxy-L-arabinose transferase-like glycosyltransferase